LIVLEKWFEKAAFSATAQHVRLKVGKAGACRIPQQGAVQKSIPISGPMR
jgi:hypothetical protein